MFQLKLNDIELVSNPEYYRKYIIAIIGDPRMLKTEGCAPSVAQRENQHPQPHRPRTDDPDRFGPDYRIKFVRSFSYLLHGGSLPSPPSFVERVVACTPARKIVDGFTERTSNGLSYAILTSRVAS
jgi:hypothetical protein